MNQHSTAKLANISHSVVVVIDLQGKLMEMIHRPNLVIAATCRLMKVADLFEVPILLTEQYREGLGGTHPRVQEVFESLSTRKQLLGKTSFGCCGDPGFEVALRDLLPGIETSERQLIIAGIEAHICVMQTVLESLTAGNQAQLCWECVSSRGAEYRQWALGRMQQAGAVMTNHESVAFEWARDKNHPQFKAMSNLLKEGQLVD